MAKKPSVYVLMNNTQANLGMGEKVTTTVLPMQIQTIPSSLDILLLIFPLYFVDVNSVIKKIIIR